ncbi:MAG: DUF6933 domain-containing protein [Acidimicrobiales bacterium]
MHLPRPCWVACRRRSKRVLRRLGLDETCLTAERKAMSEVRVGPTNDRSVVGVMNEFAFHGEWL